MVLFLPNSRTSRSSWAASLFLVLVQARGVQGWTVSPPQQQLSPWQNSVGRSTPLPATASQTEVEPTKTLEVCLSPGCVADGAEGVLLKLGALEASCPGVAVTPGVCCSLCGNGPIARNPANNQKYRKLTTNAKILNLMELDPKTLDPNQEAVLEGIDWCLKGDQELKRKNYKGGLGHYAKGLETGMTAAIALSSNSDGDSDNDNTNTASLQWVVQALSKEALCKLQTKDTEGAIVSAGTAYQLSQKKSSDALEVLQEAYQAENQAVQELEALEALFALYEQQEAEAASTKARRKRLTPMEQNKRRTLGFRLTTLQKTVKR